MADRKCCATYRQRSWGVLILHRPPSVSGLSVLYLSASLIHSLLHCLHFSMIPIDKLAILPKTSLLMPWTASVGHMTLTWQVITINTTLSDLWPLTFPLSVSPHRKLHQQFELYKDQMKKLGEEPQAAQTARAESPTCGICRKTKFANGCGRACCYCQSRFCARCGGRVPLRANKVSVCWCVSLHGEMLGPGPPSLSCLLTAWIPFGSQQLSGIFLFLSFCDSPKRGRGLGD